MTTLQIQTENTQNRLALLKKELLKLERRFNSYDREERQLKIIQQNIVNIQNISEEFLIELERIELR